MLKFTSTIRSSFPQLQLFKRGITQLSGNEFTPLAAEEIKQLNNDVYIVRFKVPENKEVEMGVSSYFYLRPSEKGTPRAFTPISRINAKGHIDFLIKCYPTGGIGERVRKLKVGDTIDIRGPLLKMDFREHKKNLNKIGMIAGGTGVAPMYQILREVLEEDSKTEFYLMYANRTEADVVYKDELDQLASKYKNFKVHYTVDEISSNLWEGGVGYIDSEKISSFFPPPSNDIKILICGPPFMLKSISGRRNPDKSQGELSGELLKAGYTKDMVFKF